MRPLLPTVVDLHWLLVWKCVQADTKASDKHRPSWEQNPTWKYQVASLLWPPSQQHIAPLNGALSVHAPNHSIPPTQMSYSYADSQLTSTASTHTHSGNLTEINTERIIGRRCRCAGCRALRPEKRTWCVVNGKWRWVILTLLALMIFLLGIATQPGRENVSMQTDVRKAFGVSCHASARVMWFTVAPRRSPGTNLMMLISARHYFGQWFTDFFWHTCSSWKKLINL